MLPNGRPYAGAFAGNAHYDSEAGICVRYFFEELIFKREANFPGLPNSSLPP